MLDKMKAKHWVIGAVAVLLVGLLAYRIFGYEIYTKSGEARAQVDFVKEFLAPLALESTKAQKPVNPQELIDKSGYAPRTFVDPWGERLIIKCAVESTACSILIYSKGPNRADEGGAGDDVVAR